jgi:hypothetical protein
VLGADSSAEDERRRSGVHRPRDLEHRN